MLNNRMWFTHNLKRHKERVKNMRGQVDSSAPKVPKADSKTKIGKALHRAALVNNDNARLLVRLTKVFAHGGNLKPADIGQGAAAEKQRKALRKGASAVSSRRSELNRITFDNKLLLNRIISAAPVINFKDEHFVTSNRRHKQLREETTYYRQKHSPFPPPLVWEAKPPRATSFVGSSAAGSGITSPSLKARPHSAQCTTRKKTAAQRRTGLKVRAQSALPSHLQQHTAEEEARCWEHPSVYLERVNGEHLNTLFAMKRPPELVKRVFAAIMILVSPFALSSVDMSWCAVQRWVEEVGGADAFLDNLRAFELSMVPEENTASTQVFLNRLGHSLEPRVLRDVSDSLAEVCDWTLAMCASTDLQDSQVQGGTVSCYSEEPNARASESTPTSNNSDDEEDLYV